MVSQLHCNYETWLLWCDFQAGSFARETSRKEFKQNKPSRLSSSFLMQEILSLGDQERLVCTKGDARLKVCKRVVYAVDSGQPH